MLSRTKSSANCADMPTSVSLRRVDARGTLLKPVYACPASFWLPACFHMEVVGRMSVWSGSVDLACGIGAAVSRPACGDHVGRWSICKPARGIGNEAVQLPFRTSDLSGLRTRSSSGNAGICRMCDRFLPIELSARGVASAVAKLGLKRTTLISKMQKLGSSRGRWHVRVDVPAAFLSVDRDWTQQ